MKAWESKNAKRAMQGAGLTTMAVTLAACGGSDDTTTTTPTTPVTPPTVTPINRAFTVNATESIVGTTADDTVRGDSADVTVSDSFDGGAGNDTFTLNHTGEGAVVLPTLVSVETVVINEAVDTDEDGTGLSVDAGNARDVTTWVLDNLDDDAAITNADTTDVVRIIDNDGTTVDVTVGYRAVTGTADSARIEVDAFDASSDLIVTAGLETLTIAGVGATASTIAELDIDGVTTLNLSATNSALTITEADAGADNEVTSIVISGDQAVTITNALSTAVTSIDASASTGGASVTLAGLTAPTFTGGAGADTITAVTATSVVNTGAGNDVVTLGATVLTSAASLNGGAGTDVLVIGDDTTAVFTATARAAISGFETLRVSGVNTETVDFDLLAGFTGLQLGANTALTVDDISNAVTAAGVAVLGVQTTSLIFTVDDATVPGTANTLALNLDHTTANTAVTIADLQAAGVETLTVTSNGAGTNTNSIELGTENTALTDVNISGASRFTLTVQGNADVGGGAVTVNGGAATGILTINLVGEDDGTVITTGSAADVVTGGTAVDVVNSGAGNDVLNISGGLDRYTGGAGSDDYRFGASYDNSDDAIRISDFQTGTGGDIISFDVSEMDGAVGDLVDNLLLANYVEGTVATIGTNTSATAFASDSLMVITDTGFANYAAVETELAIEAGAALTDIAVVFFNSTLGYAQMFVSDTTANATNDFLAVEFTNITSLAALAELNAGNFADI